MLAFFLLIFLACGQAEEGFKDAIIETDALDRVIDWVQATIFPKMNTNIVFAGDTKTWDQIVPQLAQKHALVSVDVDNGDPDDLEYVRWMLHDTAFSAMVIAKQAWTKDIAELFAMIRYQQNSLVIMIGFVDPTTLDWDDSRVEKHLIYIHEKPQENIIAVYVYCAGHKNLGPQIVNAWKDKKVDQGFKKVTDVCPHFLSQHLKVSLSRVPPYSYTDPKTGKIAGPDYEVAKNMGRKFKYTMEFVAPKFSVVTSDFETRPPANGTVYGLLQQWQVTFAIGFRVLESQGLVHVDYTSFLWTLESGWVTRIPIPKDTFYQIVGIFPLRVWLIIYFSLLCLSGAFAFVYFVYRRYFPNPDQLTASNILWVDFFILPFAKFVEPDPIPWFKGWSTGRLLVLLWSLYTMLLVFFYTCNLRAHLLRVDLEKKVDTNEDALERGTRVYNSVLVNIMNHKFPLTGPYMSETERKLSMKTWEENTRIPVKFGSWAQYVKEDVVKSGAVHFGTFGGTLYDYVRSQRIHPDDSTFRSYGFLTFVLGKQNRVFHTGFCLRKYSPYREDMDRYLSLTRAMGLYLKYVFDPIPLEARTQWTPSNERPNETPLEFQTLFLITIFLCIGLFIAFLVFLYEIFVWKYVKKRKLIRPIISK